jgi:hypothetical protein
VNDLQIENIDSKLDSKKWLINSTKIITMSLSSVLLLTSVDSFFFSFRFNQRKEKMPNEVAHALAKAVTF